MTRYSTEPRTKSMSKYKYRFLSFARYLSNKCGNQLLNTATKTRLAALKTASKKIVHKKVMRNKKLMGNKIVYKVVKPNLYLMRIQELLKKQFQEKKEKKY